MECKYVPESSSFACHVVIQLFFRSQPHTKRQPTNTKYYPTRLLIQLINIWYFCRYPIQSMIPSYFLILIIIWAADQSNENSPVPEFISPKFHDILWIFPILSEYSRKVEGTCIATWFKCHRLFGHLYPPRARLL